MSNSVALTARLAMSLGGLGMTIDEPGTHGVVFQYSRLGLSVHSSVIDLYGAGLWTLMVSVKVGDRALPETLIQSIDDLEYFTAMVAELVKASPTILSPLKPLEDAT